MSRPPFSSGSTSAPCGSARHGYQVAVLQQVAWYAGVALITLALVGPAGALADRLMIAHMIEHLLIADLAAPLLLVGLRTPVLQFLLPRPALVTLARRRRLRAALRLLRDFPFPNRRSLRVLAQTLKPGPQVGLAGSVLLPGVNRVAFGLIGQDQKFVYGPSALYVARSPSGRARGPFLAPPEMGLDLRTGRISARPRRPTPRTSRPSTHRGQSEGRRWRHRHSRAA